MKWHHFNSIEILSHFKYAKITFDTNASAFNSMAVHRMFGSVTLVRLFFLLILGIVDSLEQFISMRKTMLRDFRRINDYCFGLVDNINGHNLW